MAIWNQAHSSYPEPLGHSKKPLDRQKGIQLICPKSNFTPWRFHRKHQWLTNLHKSHQNPTPCPPPDGGDSSDVQDELKNVEHIQANSLAFAALKTNGSVVTWGTLDAGGDSSVVQDQFMMWQRTLERKIEAQFLFCTEFRRETTIRCYEGLVFNDVLCRFGVFWYGVGYNNVCLVAYHAKMYGWMTMAYLECKQCV